MLQSGMMAPSIIVPLLAREIGFTIGVTTGNEADLEAADYIRYCAEDEATRVIACYTEQIKTPARFIAACQLAAEREKPIVMLKIGRSEIAQRSALAHTGSLVGADDVTDAVLRKLGVVRVDTVDDLYEAIAVFHTRKLPRGRRGGAGLGIGRGRRAAGRPGAGDRRRVPAAAPETAAELRKIVPEYGNVGNPLDITGQGVFDTEMVRGAFDQLATAGNLDIVVWARSFPCQPGSADAGRANPGAGGREVPGDRVPGDGAGERPLPLPDLPGPAGWPSRSTTWTASRSSRAASRA